MNLETLWLAFWLFLPAGVANLSPVLANKVPLLKNWQTPLDLGNKFNGKRILGDNKTWRGLTTGTVMAALVSILEFEILTKFNLLADSILIVGLSGALMGFGALAGDAAASFFKRQLKIKPGKSWFPFDQLDYIVGGLALSFPLIRWPLELMLYITIIYFGLHLIVSYIGYRLGLKPSPI